MNIKDAKNEIINTLRAYLKKDSSGKFVYPLVRQRPILLIGPPGIGKTAIMEQIADKCQVGLVAYTITHHTRQSAVGLPKIVTRIYNGVPVDVTEYTMSEIIASVYDCMEKTGKKEGILFVDEINCVSETLAPAMLQFLQNKTFGTHKVPEGWIIVAAGNPPAYNKSVREFDIVTLDRVRKIEILPDTETWLEYARENQIHGAVISYLSMKKDNFYAAENTVDGKVFVTARGWEDLSELLKSYEEMEIEAGEELIGEFLQKEEIVRDFSAYYRLYQKYKMDYHISEILEGTLPEAAYEKCCQMAENARFEESFTITELILEVLAGQAALWSKGDLRILHLWENIRQLKEFLKGKNEIEAMTDFLAVRRKSLEAKVDSELLLKREKKEEEEQLQIMEEYFCRLHEGHIHSVEDGLKKMQGFLDEESRLLKKEEKRMKKMLENAFPFLIKCFGEGQELFLLETGLTGNSRVTSFISSHGCAAYFQYCDLLLCGEQEQVMKKKCQEILKENGKITS